MRVMKDFNENFSLELLDAFEVSAVLSILHVQRKFDMWAVYLQSSFTRICSTSALLSKRIKVYYYSTPFLVKKSHLFVIATCISTERHTNYAHSTASDRVVMLSWKGSRDNNIAQKL